MIQKIKDNFPKISWDKNKKLLGFLTLVFVLVIYFAFFGKSDIKAQPASYATVSAPKQERLSLKPKLKPLSNKSHETKSKIDIDKYHKDVINSITYNTMGTYKLPDEINDKLKIEIDSVFIRQMNAITKSYKYYKINILASDTSGTIIFQKL